jgi:aminopeptidase N
MSRLAPNPLARGAVLATLAASVLALAPGAHLGPVPAAAQTASFTRADTLRGSIGPERAWWEVRFYDLHVAVDPADSTIVGSNRIVYRVLTPGQVMQIDLQEPLRMDSVVHRGTKLSFKREGAAHFVTLPDRAAEGATDEVTVFYRGTPVSAANPPWDGGFVWRTDQRGRPWVATANQGLGASVWWPTRDHQTAEPDSMLIAITVPEPLTNVSNGRLREVKDNGDGTRTFVWFVSNPINNYNVSVNAAVYAHFREVYEGLDGPLDLDYWVLEADLERARRQFRQVLPMMACFEDWFGPYPFYEDGFKLVHTPYLGMEHQSAVAYGNGFQNGYRGRDLSNTGWGLLWDFIIIHEAGHEWFGNNITTADVADMWVHEGFTNYSENIYTECIYGTEAGAEYVRGTRALIQNAQPVIGVYGVQNEGSSDMYYKGGNLLHTIRQLVDDDGLWKEILRGLNRDFRHQVVTSAQVEEYVAKRSGLELGPVFDQYLRHSRIPVLQYAVDDDAVRFRWVADVKDFSMPIRVWVGGEEQWIEPAVDGWTQVSAGGPLDPGAKDGGVTVDPDFYVEVRRVDAN